MLNIFLHKSWERGCANLIILSDLADGMNYILKQSSSQYMVCNPSNIRR